MKTGNLIKIKYLLWSLVLTSLIFSSCDTDDTSDNLNGRVINQSECKSNLKGVDDYSNDMTYVEYSYNANTNKLLIKHINTGFNCCPGTISCTIIIDGNHILIKEKEEGDMGCDCLCLYDIELELNDIEETTYTLKIEELYVGNQEEIQFDVDFATTSTGEYAVSRNLYPWNLD